ncbi:protein-disulfide isomerase [Luteococcus japonicus]|uniref:Protein-disulfide isomerase n=1 Tax=Luteococcus japonicus TaxID=33984 RepID=A0A3N1ZWU4_9ACTN|nr:thioredoxin domain-containing protein [Luteococcus japonicus]ROR55208.1 protein-disulfide isomerase [Luteococcus japonicus]
MASHSAPQPPQDRQHGVATTSDGSTAGSGWQHGSSASAPSTGSPKLPWVLVAMLTALCLGLGAMLGAQSSELKRLRTQASAQPAGATSAPAASVAPPSQNPEAVAAMKKLPRRDANDPTAQGGVDAPVVMIEWSDYRCPFCSVWSRETRPKLQPYIDNGSLRIEHRDLVLFGDQSLNASLAARAAGLQGKYWEFYDAVHQAAPTNGHPEIKDTDLQAFAKKAGVPDLAKFTKDSKSAAVREAVAKDNTEARSLGISGTPFFVVNTTPLSGAQPAEVFAQVIESNGGKK